MLWGSVAAGIPIALHFFFRSRYRTVPWAAMKFLLVSIDDDAKEARFVTKKDSSCDLDAVKQAVLDSHHGKVTNHKIEKVEAKK